MSEPHFTLDPRLEADSAFIADLALSHARLMGDARFPWLLLVPRRADVFELVDLPRGDQAQMLDEINHAASALRQADWPSGPVEKLNIAALGNQVRQLHVHVIGRRSGDDAWPGPIWGVGEARPYAPEVRGALLTSLASLLASG